MTLRVVLDSNVVVSALLFPRGRLTWIRHAWMRGDFLSLVSSATSEELIRVLAYPKFRLTPDEIEALLGDYLPFTEAVRVTSSPEGTGEAGADPVPVPPDPDDRIFLELAVRGRASYLVTGDRALQEVRCPGGLEVISPEGLRAVLGG